MNVILVPVDYDLDKAEIGNIRNEISTALDGQAVVVIVPGMRGTAVLMAITTEQEQGSLTRHLYHRPPAS